MADEGRYSRQKDIVPAERLSRCKVHVIGTGAIGRQVALQLAAIGVQDLTITDFDRVEEPNLAAQGFFEQDLGKPKVEAVAAVISLINSGVTLTLQNERYRRHQRQPAEVVFCCVDSLKARSFIWESCKDTVRFFVDARMAAEVARVLTAFDGESAGYYASTLDTGEDVYSGSCTSKTTIYCANLAAALMVSSFTKWLRGIQPDRDILVDLLSMDITKMTQVQP